MPRLRGTRAEKKDVGRYTKVNMGTAQPPVSKSSLMADTRVKTGSVAEHDPVGTNAKSGSTRLRGTRVRK